MTDEELLGELRYLGFDERNYQSLAMLPLVQVAWADGQVQEQERVLIENLAREHFQLGEDSHRVVANWIKFEPTQDYMRRGRAALQELANRGHQVGLEVGELDPVIAFCHDVASAAGGLFGFGSVDIRESKALEEITLALSLDTGKNTLIDLLDTLNDEEDEEEEDVEDRDTDRQTGEEMRALRQRISVGDGLARAVSDVRIVFSETESVVGLPRSGATIGRSRQADIQVSDNGQVSRIHCKILCRDEDWYVEDVGTLNGTLVNGERVAERRLLGGEVIDVGGTQFRFEPVPTGVTQTPAAVAEADSERTLDPDEFIFPDTA